MASDIQVVNLRNQYSEPLLRRFYEELMAPSFGQFEDELEGVDVWIDLMSKPTTESDCHFNIVLLFAPEDVQQVNILGGFTVEYYPVSNCGLLAYFVVNPSLKGKGLGRILIREVLRALNDSAMKTGYEKCAGIFLETNSALKVEASLDVMDPATRHRVLHALGWRLLDFPYVQPALSDHQNKCVDLVLGVHVSSLNDPASPDLVPTMDASIVMNFMTEFFTVLMGADALETDEHYLNMVDFVARQPLLITVPPGCC